MVDARIYEPRTTRLRTHEVPTVIFHLVRAVEGARHVRTEGFHAAGGGRVSARVGSG